MIKEFNALKGILAMMIFIHHLQLYDGGGSLAVAMFFMLGGFLSVLGYKEKILKAGFSYKNYIIGKAIKFYPLHWLLLIVTLPLSLYGSKHLVAQLAIMGINASLLHSWIPIAKVYFSCNAVSWYLSDTIAFVAIFPFVLKWMITASSNQKSIISFAIVLVYSIAWITIPDDYVHRFFYINPIFRFLDFAVGMVASLFYLRLKENRSTSGYLTKNHNILMIVRIGCFIALVAMSCLSAKYTLHAVLYMPIEVVLLILIALMGGYFTDIFVGRFWYNQFRLLSNSSSSDTIFAYYIGKV